MTITSSPTLQVTAATRSLPGAAGRGRPAGPGAARRMSSYHLGWSDAGRADRSTGRRQGACGRRWRCSRPEAAGAPPRSACPGAVAVELVHNFSLVHDDLMDGDTDRRHRRPSGRSGACRARDPDRRRDAGAGPGGRCSTADRRTHRARAGCCSARPPASSSAARSRISRSRAATRSAGRVPRHGGGKTGALLAASAAIGAVLAGRPGDDVARAGRATAPGRARVPARRRRARHLGRPGGHRQAGAVRPAGAQEVAAGHLCAVSAAEQPAWSCGLADRRADWTGRG